MPRRIARGEIWLLDFNPVVGHEQAGRRPGLVASVDLFNTSPAELVVAVPLTTTHRRVRSHVPIDPPEGGLRRRSYIMCENLRSVSTTRLIRHLGTVDAATMAAVEDRLRILLDL